MRILIAGIGNIFFGDDAFGGEVARTLLEGGPWQGVRVEDFGIRSYDLACAMMEKYDAVILVDVVRMGCPPGTVVLIEPLLNQGATRHDEVVDAHSLNLESVLDMVDLLGRRPIEGQKIYLVGCEPAQLEADESGLSWQVRNAVAGAVSMIASLIQQLQRGACGS